MNICKFGVAIIYDVVSTSLLGRSGSWLRALKLCHSFFFYFFIFKLYNIVLVLPNIEIDVQVAKSK